MSDTTPAEAASTEATARTPKTITFGEGEDQITLELPAKWKRFKFMRALTSGDIGRALEAIWPPSKVLDEDGSHKRDAAGNLMYTDHPSITRLEEVNVDGPEFDAAMERIGQSVSGGVEPGNSKASLS